LGALLIILIIAFGLALLPQMWVKGVLRRHSVERPDFPGTGGEFARHLLDEMKLHHVKVEETTAMGDHYDPESKVVRLIPQHFDGRSLAAVVVAAHEVGHAMQDATNYGPLQVRTRLAKQAHGIQRVGMGIMLAAPLVMLVFKSPHVMLLQVFVGMLTLGSTIVLHGMTLPVEFDASFRRALPVLKAGRYIGDRDLSAAREILSAAALTYVAAAAMSLLDVARWFRILRW
jgi:Zn-dependent membrane protease YugP